MSSSEEKRGLTQSFKSQTGYGTATVSSSSKKSVPKSRKFISKKVSRTDTLMGIALKYGVTVQDLKKENRLWTNDSLFLRETLLIPLTSENEAALDLDDVIVSVEGNSQSSSAVTTPTTPHQSPSLFPTLFPSPSSSSSSLSSSHQHNNNNHNGNNTDTAVIEVETTPYNSYKNNNNNNHHRHSSSTRSNSSSSSSSSSSKHPSRSSSLLSSSNNSSMASPGSAASVSSPFSPMTPSSDGSDGASTSRITSTASSDDFFSKYDQSIAMLKGNVAKMGHNASTHINGFPLMDEDPMALPPQSRQHTRSYSLQPDRRRSSNGRSASMDGASAVVAGVSDEDRHQQQRRHDSPVLMIRTRTNSKLVKTTLERSQKATDDLFQL